MLNAVQFQVHETLFCNSCFIVAVVLMCREINFIHAYNETRHLNYETTNKYTILTTLKDLTIHKNITGFLSYQLAVMITLSTC